MITFYTQKVNYIVISWCSDKNTWNLFCAVVVCVQLNWGLQPPEVNLSAFIFPAPGVKASVSGQGLHSSAPVWDFPQ